MGVTHNWLGDPQLKRLHEYYEAGTAPVRKPTIARFRVQHVIQAMRHYRYEFDEKLKGLRKEPVHDQYSHAADAFRTAVMIREPEKKKEQQQRRPASKLSPWS